MAKFKIVKKVDLGYLGEEWKDCYLSFVAPTYNDIKAMAGFTVEKGKEKEIAEKGLQMLVEAFIEGKAISDKGEMVDVKKEDLGDFPVEVMIKAMKEISGQLDPNLSGA